jgi:hypothetical protein
MTSIPVDPHQHAVEQLLPWDTTDPQRMIAAAQLAAELVHALAGITRPVTTILQDPQDLDLTVAALTRLTWDAATLCEHLAGRFHALAARDGLAVDSLGAVPDGGPPVVANLAGLHIGPSGAAFQIRSAGELLDLTRQSASRLYIDETGEVGDDV